MSHILKSKSTARSPAFSRVSAARSLKTREKPWNNSSEERAVLHVSCLQNGSGNSR